MTITARDIQLKQFKVRFRGFDAQEVDYFLDQLAEAFTNLEIQNAKLSDSLKNAKTEIEELRSREDKLKKAYQELKKSVVSLKDEAQNQPTPSQNASRMIITEAQREAERILTEARSKVEKLDDDIHDLMKQKELIDEHIRKIVDMGSALLKKNDSEKSVADESETKVTHLRQIP